MHGVSNMRPSTVLSAARNTLLEQDKFTKKIYADNARQVSVVGIREHLKILN